MADDPCTVLMSSTGLLARTAPGAEDSLDDGGGTEGRAAHDVIVSSAPATVRGTIGAVTSAGRMLKLSVLEFPALPPSARFPGLSGGTPVGEFVSLEAGEKVVALASLDTPQAGLALGTAFRRGQARAAGLSAGAGRFEVIALKDGDRVVGAVQLREESHDLVFVSSDAQLLRFPASAVRPQGRLAGGMAGIRLAPRASAVWVGAVDPAGAGPGADGDGAGTDGGAGGPVVSPWPGAPVPCPGPRPGSVKVSPYAEFPPKGRATGGVRCHRFLKGEDELILAWAGPGPRSGRPRRAGRWSCRGHSADGTAQGSA